MHWISRAMFTVVCVACIAVPSAAFAQNPPPPSFEYTLLAPFSGIMDTKFDISQDGLEKYLSGIFTIAIGLAGVLAVVMLVVCGIKVMGAGSASAKSEAKECLTNAIFGLLLAIGSWVLLNTINPDLVSTDLRAPETAGTVAAPTPDIITAPPPTTPGIWYFQLRNPATGRVENRTFYHPGECATQHKYYKDLYDRDNAQFEPITDCIQVKQVAQGEADIRERLKQSNIYVNKGPCSSLSVKELNCTSVQGLSDSAVNAIIALANAVGGNSSACTQNAALLRLAPCKVVVTGGTEIDSHTILAGSSNHSTYHGGAGKTFDIAKTQPLIDYFRTRSAKVADSFKASSKDPNSVTYKRYYFEDERYWCTEEATHFHCCSEDTSAWYCKENSILAGGKVGKLHCKDNPSGGPKVCEPCDPAKSNDRYECPKD